MGLWVFIQAMGQWVSKQVVVQTDIKGGLVEDESTNRHTVRWTATLPVRRKRQAFCHTGRVPIPGHEPGWLQR